MKTFFHLYIAIFTTLVLTVSAFAQTADPPSGSGTLGDPYLIATLNNLYWITQNSGEWGKVYKQTADIDATTDSTWDGKQGFTPIGNDTTNFTGSYDGQTYKITGLYINRSTNYQGLLGYVNSAAITNIKLEGVNIFYCGGSVGGLIGYQVGGTVTNCYSTGYVTGYCVGGLLGEQHGGTVSNCYSAGDVFGMGAGGLIGEQDGGTVSNCYSTGPVEGYSVCVGGLIGDQKNSATVSDCYSTSSVTGSHIFCGGLIGFQENSTASNCHSTGFVEAHGLSSVVGGLIGLQRGSIIANCYSTGDIYGFCVGGLIGWQDSGTISNCYSTGPVDGGFGSVGGLIGWQDGGTISNCYCTGPVEGYSGSVGGLIGNQSGIVSNCFSTGNVHSFDTDAGGLIGEQKSGTASNCFWDIQTSNQLSSAGGIGKSTSAMKTQSTFIGAGWDVTIWSMEHGKNNGYPYLKWQYLPLPVELTEVEIRVVPKELTLAQNYPNPFNPSTTMEFTVPENGRASLKIYNTIGQLVATAFDGDVNAGNIQKVTFTASHLSSGVYFSRLEYNGKTLLKKLVLMK